MTISLGGLASGIDTDSLVTSLVAAARQPIDQLNARKAQVDSASQTVTTISSKLSAVKTAALALTTLVGFGATAASSSDTAIVASANGGAQVGSYSLSVSALARSQKLKSDTVASSTAALGQTGSLKIQVGSGTALTVNVGATDTLSDIATKISASGARVSASVLSDGTNYRLLVQGLDSGAANAFTVTETGVSLGLGDSANVYQTAQDAAFKVDGIAITRPTNQITGVISGVTLALTKETTGTTVTVASDTTSLKQKVNSFVSAYNDLVNTGHTATGFGAAKATNSVLTADGAIRTSLHRLADVVTTAVPGTSGAYRSLGAVGLDLKADGTLTFDATKFDTAMSKDPSSVRRIFVTDTTIGATGVMKTMMDAVDKLTTGTGAPIKARLDALSSQSKRIADSATAMDRRAADYEALLKKQFSDMDQAISRYNSMKTAVGSIGT